MNNLKSLLELLRTQPETYLGRESISKLSSFLDGFYTRVWAPRCGRDPFLLKFQDWVKEKYQLRSAYHAWFTIILFVERNDEVRAFRKFFELIEEFQNESGVVCGFIQMQMRGAPPEILQDGKFPYDQAQFFLLLSEIKARPGMYMYGMISRISAFIDGYFLACSFNPPRSHPLWVRFTAWLKARRQLTGDYRWDDIIFFSAQNEGIGFTQFFELFEEFLTEEWNKQEAVCNPARRSDLD